LKGQVDALFRKRRPYPPSSPLFPYTTLFRSLAYTVARATNEIGIRMALGAQRAKVLGLVFRSALRLLAFGLALGIPAAWAGSRLDRKSTRLNSSHVAISYAVFCLKKKKNMNH